MFRFLFSCEDQIRSETKLKTLKKLFQMKSIKHHSLTLSKAIIKSFLKPVQVRTAISMTLSILLFVNTILVSLTAHSKSETKNDLSEIKLVTPYDFDDGEYKNAIRIPFIEGRAVCLPPNEYRRMVKQDLGYDSLRETCLEPPKFRDEFQGYSFGLGFLVGTLSGIVLGLYLNR